jgi:hypothetical protein
MGNLLSGKRGLLTGAASGIGVKWRSRRGKRRAALNEGSEVKLGVVGLTVFPALRRSLGQIQMFLHICRPPVKEGRLYPPTWGGERTDCVLLVG